MSEYGWALFGHVLGVALLAGGMAVAGVGLRAARRRERPAEAALLLGTTRTGLLLVALGSVLVLTCGFWLVDVTGHGFDEGWLTGSFGLFLTGVVLGAVGGRRPKQARLLAERLAREDNEPSLELQRLLDDRLSAALNAAATIAMLGVLLLMVWRPG